MPFLSPALADALLQTFAAKFPDGSTVELRTGAATGAGDDAKGKLLVSVKLLPYPWDTPRDGILHKQGEWIGRALEGGRIGHYRMASPDGVHREVGSVSDLEGDGEMRIEDVTVVPGQPVEIKVFTKTA
jgi:hypothetical protein